MTLLDAAGRALTLAEIAEIAEQRDGCEPGVAWGRKHTFADLPGDFAPSWAWWLIEHCADVLTDAQRAVFIDIVRSDPPLAAVVWRTSTRLTDAEATVCLDSAQAALPHLRERVERGEVVTEKERLSRGER